MLINALFDASPAKSAGVRFTLNHFSAVGTFSMRTSSELSRFETIDIGFGEDRMRQRHDEQQGSIDPKPEETTSLAPRNCCRDKTKDDRDQEDFHDVLTRVCPTVG